MAYKRQSPTPIKESGTNYTVMNNTNGTIIFDGTGLNTINPGIAGNVLTSMGALAAPSFQPLAGSGSSWIGSSPGGVCQLSKFDGLGETIQVTTINAPVTFSNGAGITIHPVFPFPFACKISNLYVVVTSNSSSVTTNSFIAINGVNTAMTVSIGSGTTGTFTDLVHTVMVSQGDLLTFSSNPTGGAGQLVNGNFTIQITP